MTSPNTSLAHRARQFAKLNRQCIELAYEPAKPNTSEEMQEYMRELFSLSSNAFELWNEIKMQLGKTQIARIADGDTRKILRDIRNDKNFYVIRCYQRIADLFNVGEENELELWPTTIEDHIRNQFDDNLSDFLSGFDLDGYYIAKAKLGTIVILHHSESVLDNYYYEIREAYSFALYRACVSLCRALIEIVLYDELKKRKVLRADKAVDIRTGREKKYYLGYLIQLARRKEILGIDEERRAKRVKRTAEKVLHVRDKVGADVETSADLTFKVVNDTIAVVEYILAK